MRFQLHGVVINQAVGNVLSLYITELMADTWQIITVCFFIFLDISIIIFRSLVCV